MRAITKSIWVVVSISVSGWAGCAHLSSESEQADMESIRSVVAEQTSDADHERREAGVGCSARADWRDSWPSTAVAGPINETIPGPHGE